MRVAWSLLLALSCLRAAVASHREVEFTVVAYNLENLFDVDGFALYDDYAQDPVDAPFRYTRRKLLTKLRNTAKVLATLNDGAGPEIILFQELEADFTRESSVADLRAFLSQYEDTTVEQMLTSGWHAEYAGFPAVAWLMKALSDAGLRDYDAVYAPAKPVEAGVAHTNAVFSTFPIRSVRRHELERARDILEVEVDVQGRRLVVLDNHWKSGASSPELEPIRVQNAGVLRRLIDARLAKDPQADIIIGGDLNSHYNHSTLHPKLETGINDVLGSQGNETFAGARLYNLWFELPPEQRYSEVWRGRRGTLMHLLLTRGLYDGEGISYVDGSFHQLCLPGLNADAIGRPLAWNFAGTAGGGVSDHFPVCARFSTRAFEQNGAFSSGEDAPDREIPLSVAGAASAAIDFPDGAFLESLDQADFGPFVDRLYCVKATVLQMKPLEIKIGRRRWAAYCVNRSMIGAGGLPADLKRAKGRVRLVVRLHFYHGKKELVIEDILGTWR